MKSDSVTESKSESALSRLSPSRRLLLEQRLKANTDATATNSIHTRPEGEDLPLSFAQERMWIIERMVPGTALYNVFSAWQLSGTIDKNTFQLALDRVLSRQKALRTQLQERESGIVQHVIPASLRIVSHDLRHLDPDARESERERLQEGIITRPFELENPPLVRATLIHLSASLHDLLIVMHHIASDGWSRAIFSRELSECYAAALEGREPRLPALPVQYADYAVWQRAWLQGEELQRQLGYWRKQLDGLAPLELPADRPRPAQMSYRGAVARFALPTELVVHLKALAREENATLFMVLMAAFQTLLMRYSGQEDFAVGIPVAGRNRPELEGLVGFFVNTLVLRGQLEGNPPFRELLARTRETALEAYGHQDLPFEKLVEALNPARDLSRNPLFQVMFALRNMPAEALSLPGVEAQRLPLHGRSAKFDLTLSLTETGGRLEGVLEYATDLFDAGRIGRMAGHFLRLLEGLVEAPETPLWRLPLLSEAERHQLLVEWNQTERAYPHDSCIHQLFEAQAARTPDAVAVVHGERSLSYGELNARANRLAHHLIGLGVGPDTLVGLCVERSVEMVVGMLGILKAGGAYVPLDPAYPKSRLSFMLQDAGISVLLIQRAVKIKLPPCECELILLDDDWPDGSIGRLDSTLRSSGGR